MTYIFVEGPDDYNFFAKIYGNQLYDYKIIKYAELKKDAVNKFLGSIDSMPDSDYIFFGDEDGKGIAVKKNELITLYDNLSKEKVYIVQHEIESWYYAGISRDNCKKLKLKNYQENTDTLTKEQFNAKLFRPSDRKYIMSQILTYYSKELAQTRNSSFLYYYSKIKESAAV